MRLFFLLVLGAVWYRLSFSTTVRSGSAALHNALAVSEYKAFLAKTQGSIRSNSRQSTTFENIPVCETSVGEDASKRHFQCEGCREALVLEDSGLDPAFIESACPSGCCGEYSLEAVATGHFIHCQAGCCTRLVSLQVSDSSTPEHLQLALDLQIVINNEYTISGVGQLDRCELSETPSESDACQPRCAYLFNDPGRCEGRSTVNVPVFGQSMDPENLPCSEREPGADAGTPGSGADTESEAGTTNNSPGPSESPSSDESGSASTDSNVCIDAQALGHLRPHELAFEKHVLAHVLCDANGSCSTPGHIVVFRHRSMMMRTYCSLVQCTTDIMYVNSPRLNCRVRVPSKTKGLEFSAFAARYETRAEELLMSAVIRAGF